jgi:hypothetical protein
VLGWYTLRSIRLYAATPSVRTAAKAESINGTLLLDISTIVSKSSLEFNQIFQMDNLEKHHKHMASKIAYFTSTGE